MNTNSKLSRKPLSLTVTSLLLATVCLVFVGIAQKSSAQLVADYNFDSLTVGSAIPTTNPNVDTYPQQTVYAVGGYPNDLDVSDSNPLTGSVTVQNVGTMSKAALMSTTQAGTGALISTRRCWPPVRRYP